MFDMIGVALICVRADQEVQGSMWKCLTLPDNPRQTSGPIEILDKIFPAIFGREKFINLSPIYTSAFSF